MEVEVTLDYGLNYWAVLVAAAAYWILGALWYSPPLFAKAWMKGIGKSEEQVRADFSPLKYLWSFITAFVASYGLARLMLWTGAGSIGDGFQVGLLVGVSIVFVTVAMHDIMENRPKSLTLVNGLYSIIGFVVMGIIIAVWR